MTRNVRDNFQYHTKFGLPSTVPAVYGIRLSAESARNCHRCNSSVEEPNGNHPVVLSALATRLLLWFSCISELNLYLPLTPYFYLPVLLACDRGARPLERGCVIDLWQRKEPRRLTVSLVYDSKQKGGDDKKAITLSVFA